MRCFEGGGWWGMALALALGAAGCGSGPTPDDEARRLQEISQQGESLTRAADALEERMLADQANLLLWKELAERHRHVSAIATQNHAEHFSSMVELIERQTEKARKLKRRNVAEAEGVPEDGEDATGPRERPVLSRATAPGASRARN